MKATKDQIRGIVGVFQDILAKAEDKLNTKEMEMTEPYAHYTPAKDGGTYRAVCLNDLPSEAFQAMDSATEAVSRAKMVIREGLRFWELGQISDEDLVFKAAQANVNLAMEAVDKALEAPNPRPKTRPRPIKARFGETRPAFPVS